jgi:hypothetical protein
MLALGTFQPQLKPTDCERFRSLASDVIPPRIQTDTAEECEKAAPAVIASIASANWL